MDSKIRRSRINLASLAAASLVAGTVASLTPQVVNADELATFRSLGSGAEVRSSLLNRFTTNAADVAPTPTPVSKTGEGKCGEGKCG